MPQISGRMPYSPLLTSQVVDVRNSSPWSWIPGARLAADLPQDAAEQEQQQPGAGDGQQRGSRGRRSSPSRSADPRPSPACSSVCEARHGAAARYWMLAAALPHRGHHARGQRDVAHLHADLLAVGQAVLDHLAQRRRLLRVLVLLVEQHPGVGRDGIGLGAFRVGQPQPHVRRQLGVQQRLRPALAAGRRRTGRPCSGAGRSRTLASLAKPNSM